MTSTYLCPEAPLQELARNLQSPNELARQLNQRLSGPWFSLVVRIADAGNASEEGSNGYNNHSCLR